MFSNLSGNNTGSHCSEEEHKGINMPLCERHTHTHTHTHAHTHTHTCAWLTHHESKHTHTHRAHVWWHILHAHTTHTHAIGTLSMHMTHAQTYKHNTQYVLHYKQTHMHMHMQVHTHTCAHTHTHTHTLPYLVSKMRTTFFTCLTASSWSTASLPQCCTKFSSNNLWHTPIVLNQ